MHLISHPVHLKKISSKCTMTRITHLDALEILDSRGFPTLQVFVKTDSSIGAACVPSGASTGEHEALELRDKDPKRYLGKGVLKASQHITGPLKEALIGENVLDQKKCDQLLIDLDGTKNKSKFGANATLGVSLAIARAAALCEQKELFKYLNPKASLLPMPMLNVINGGAHADNSIEFQEFMIRPTGASTFSEALRWSSEVFHHLKKLLQEKKLTTSVGDEGGFAPNLPSNEAALDLLIQAIEKAGYQMERDFHLALDCAASEFYNREKKAYIEKKNPKSQVLKSSEDQIEELFKLTQKYPIDSLEDGLDENDWEGWVKLTQRLGFIQLVGDDLFVTNPLFFQKGIDLKIANAILIKPNQIGTLSETLQTIQLAQKNGYKTVISHRSGETEDTFIADLAVATSSGQIKTGSLSRSDRVSKYNRLLRIEQLLGSKAHFASKA